MNVLVVGGASGLGAAAARAFHADGAQVAIADLDGDRARALADELGARARHIRADVTRDDDVAAAMRAAAAAGPLRAVIACAGVIHAERLIRKGTPHARESWDRTIGVNLTGTFNVLRHAAAAMSVNEPDEEGQRGVVVTTASIAAFDGQTGSVAYAASKAAIAGMTLPAARDLADLGVRVCAIAPGAFETPLFVGLPARARLLLAERIPFPRRLGRPDEYAKLVLHVVHNPMLNGEVIRLDAALRMPYR